MMKAGKVLKYFIKLAISGILALVILSVFCLIYFNPPMPTPQTEEYSNTKYIENRYWVSFREGFGFGKTNELGYNDAPIRDESAPRVAIIGSSHTVGLQVNQKNIYPVLTEALFLADNDQENDFECISVASAGQYFNSSISNVEPLAKNFENLKYVIIETPDLDYSEDAFERMVRGEYHQQQEEESPIYRLAQSIPYLRLFANQYQSSKEPLNSAPGMFIDRSSYIDYDAYERGFRKAADMLRSLSEEYGFQLIILHHAAPMTDPSGELCSAHDSGYLEILERCCDEYGITFLDMCNEFTEYDKNGTESAYGFANTRPGVGHLNKNGHRLIAQKLYETICELEEVD